MRKSILFGIVALTGACNSVLHVDEGSPRSPSGAEAGSTGDPGGECKTSAECLEASGEFDPSACVAGRCVKLLTDDCPLVLPQTDRQWVDNLKSTDPEPVIVGIFSSVPPSGTLFSLLSENYDLPLSDLTHAVGGLPAAGGKHRKVVAVVCRNIYPSPEALDAAVDHLAGELAVPGIIAGLATTDFERAFARSAEHHVFFMNPYGGEVNADLTGDGLIWSMLPAAKDLAPTYGPLLERTIEHLHDIGSLGPDEPVRVALVFDHDYRPSSDLAQALTDVIQFNGGSVAENTQNGYFRSYSIASQVLSSQPLDDSSAVSDLLDFAPHIVISEATDEFPIDFMPALELYAKLKPTYLLGPWNYQDLNVTYLATAIEGLQARIIGTNYAAAVDQTVYDAYHAHFAAAFPSDASANGYENFYDAAYYLLYAGIAAGTKVPLVGPDLTLGMRRLLSGRSEFAVGPEDLPGAYKALQTPNETITLNGAMGPPDFDDTGARHDSSTVWCLMPDRSVKIDVLRLNSEGSLEGDFPCFSLP
jgi:hypothetical protein